MCFLVVWVAATMLEAGACHLIFLSRSGASTSEQKAVLKKLEARGCNVDAFRCDISNAAQVAHIMDLASENSWRLKGLVQCTMGFESRLNTVLRDIIPQKFLKC